MCIEIRGEITIFVSTIRNQSGEGARCSLIFLITTNQKIIDND